MNQKLIEIKFLNIFRKGSRLICGNRGRFR